MNCWNCGKKLSSNRVSFRTTCDHCDAWLHCCLGCRYYSPGRANDCKVPGTEPIADRTAVNFCEEFAVATTPFSSKTADPKEVARRLFGED